MSDVTPEAFSSPGPKVAGNQVTIRVGVFNYIFEKTPEDTLIYVNRYPAAIPEDDDEPFDPTQYR